MATPRDRAVQRIGGLQIKEYENFIVAYDLMMEHEGLAFGTENPVSTKSKKRVRSYKRRRQPGTVGNGTRINDLVFTALKSQPTVPATSNQIRSIIRQQGGKTVKRQSISAALCHMMKAGYTVKRVNRGWYQYVV